MPKDTRIVESEDEAVAKLIAGVNPSLYKDIETVMKQLKEVTDWLHINRDTEDVKIASQLIVYKNKEKRLSSQLDALLSTKDELEFHGLDFVRLASEVKEAKEAITVLTALKTKVDNVDEKYYFYLASTLTFKMQIDAELSRNEVLISQFEKEVLATSPFNAIYKG